MTSNMELLFCSNDMQNFMDKHHVTSIRQLFEVSLNELILFPDFPLRLLEEWVTLRDRINILCEN